MRFVLGAARHQNITVFYGIGITFFGCTRVVAQGTGLARRQAPRCTEAYVIDPPAKVDGLAALAISSLDLGRPSLS